MAASEGDGLWACNDGPCELLPTKNAPLIQITGGKDRKVEHRLNRARQIRQERISGYPRSLSNMTTLDFQTLLLFDALYERFQMRAELEQREMLEESVTLMTGLIQAMVTPKG